MNRSVWSRAALARGAALLLAGGSLSAAGAARAAAEAAREADDPEKVAVLVVALDAVPYDVVATLTSEGEVAQRAFRDLPPPAPLVAAFPSTTTVTFAGMFEPFGAALPPGYEVRFFDRASKRVRGGGPVTYRQIEFSWHTFFDWKTDGLMRKAFGYAGPLRFGSSEVRRLVRAFERHSLSGDGPRIFFAYVAASDAVGHLKGPARLPAMLRELDTGISELRRRSTQPFHVVLFSDHGMAGGAPLHNLRREVERSVRARDFAIGRRLRRPKDVVFVPFGLLSSFVAFTDQAHAAELGQTLAGVPGVELCAVPEGAAVRVYGKAGSATIERRFRGEQEEWRYLPQDGDPLGYVPVLERLGTRGDTSGGFAALDDWLRASADHRFPDAPHRLARAFDLVGSAASTVCSTAPGTMYGASLTEVSGRFSVGRLRYTHGALERGDSLGFVLSDHPAIAIGGPIAFDRLFARFAAEAGLTHAPAPALRAAVLESRDGGAQRAEVQRP